MVTNVNFLHPKWEAATKEVLYAACPVCCLRLEVELHGDGTELTTLWQGWCAHHALAKFHLDQRFLSWREQHEWRKSVKCETIEVYRPIIISDIISKRAIKRRAQRLVGRSQTLSIESAIAQVRSKVRRATLSEGHYVCRVCGRRITKKRAEGNGIGVRCRRSISM